jgi:hypothetical protein
MRRFMGKPFLIWLFPSQLDHVLLEAFATRGPFIHMEFVGFSNGACFGPQSDCG